MSARCKQPVWSLWAVRDAALDNKVAQISVVSWQRLRQDFHHAPSPSEQAAAGMIARG